ncbi:hypothetical protein HGRIS_002031 [Hohenbuehelia grisea]|uniref:C2H2-type domain-containing protein n=1 Tax=Hohenbuehelia grisea TaxID=104357 RepID=A0ABR3JKA2_9AGAR
MSSTSTQRLRSEFPDRPENCCSGILTSICFVSSPFDDDPSLRSFPIDNGMFRDEKPVESEVVVLYQPHIPLNILLGRTVADCFADVPTPDFGLDSDDSYESESSPFCQYNPLAAREAEVAVLTDMFGGAVTIQSPPVTPEFIPVQPEMAEADQPTTSSSSSASALDHSFLHEPVEFANPEHLSSASSSSPSIERQSIAPLRSKKSPRNRRKAGIRPISTPQLRLASVSSIEADDAVPSTLDSCDTTSGSPSSRRTTPPRAAKRPVSYNEVNMDDDRSPTFADDEGIGSSIDATVEPAPQAIRTKRHRPSKKALALGINFDYDETGVRRWLCPEPSCGRTFSRLNDTIRHLKQTFAHSPQSAESATCSKCGASLSRSDARKRHEAKGACGKRSLRKNAKNAMGGISVQQMGT